MISQVGGGHAWPTYEYTNIKTASLLPFLYPLGSSYSCHFLMKGLLRTVIRFIVTRPPLSFFFLL